MDLHKGALYVYRLEQKVTQMAILDPNPVVQIMKNIRNRCLNNLEKYHSYRPISFWSEYSSKSCDGLES